MSVTIPQTDWIERANQTLTILRKQRVLHGGIKASVDAFFDAHPEVERTPENEDWLTILAFQRLADQSQKGATE